MVNELGGEDACPSEDCGDPPGYEHLQEVLADPDDEEHDDMVMWMDLKRASEFAVAFDVEQVNRRILAVDAPR